MICAIPPFLGFIESLSGLNISDNPLEFPPQSVLDKGSSYILKYFKKCLTCKGKGKASKKRLVKIRIQYNVRELYYAVMYNLLLLKW